MEELAQSVGNAKMPGQVDSDVASERRGGCVQLWGLALPARRNIHQLRNLLSQCLENGPFSLPHSQSSFRRVRLATDRFGAFRAAWIVAEKHAAAFTSTSNVATGKCRRNQAKDNNCPKHKRHRIRLSRAAPN